MILEEFVMSFAKTIVAIFVPATLISVVAVAISLTKELEVIGGNNILVPTFIASVTAISILFSMMLVVFSQLAQNTSPALMQKTFNDKAFRYVGLYIFLYILYVLGFLLLGKSNIYIHCILIAMFLILLVLLYLSVRHAIWLFNPRNSIFEPIEESLKRYVTEEISLSSKRAARSILLEGTREFQLTKKIAQHMHKELLPVRNIALRSIKNLQIEETIHALDTLRRISVHYLKQRKSWSISQDEVMIFLSGELELLLKTSSNELKVDLHPELAKMWGEIGIQATRVNMHKSISVSYNHLLYFPSKALELICVINLKEEYSQAPCQAIHSFAAIGRELILERYDYQAAEIAGSLATVALVADKAPSQYYVIHDANCAMLDILCSGLARRDTLRKEPSDQAFSRMIDAITLTLENRLKQKRDSFQDGAIAPFIGRLNDPRLRTNLSTAIDCALFRSNLDELSLDYNIKTVKRIYEKVYMPTYAKEGKQYGNLQDDILDTMYRSQLLLLSVFAPSVAKNIVLNPVAI